LQGQQNETKPVAMHPRGEILAKWAGFAQPEWKARALVELWGMDGKKASSCFCSTTERAAEVQFAEQLERPSVNAREVVTGETRKTARKQFTVKTEVPAQAVRIYRIDY
jgi:hypothetical protein